MIAEQERLRQALAAALDEVRRTGAWEDDDGAAPPAIEISRPARREHGDYTTNLALALAGKARMAPRALAEAILQALPETDVIARAEVAGPGFINVFLTHAWIQDTIRAVVAEGDRFGRSDTGAGAPVNVEFVSANPTGPLHVGAGRNAAYGDALASLLAVAGYAVSREYYINDAGLQIEWFVASLEARYRQALGGDAAAAPEATVPEDGYQGQYLADLGASLAEQKGDEYLGDRDALTAWGLEQMLGVIRSTLDRFGVHFDTWFSEQSLHASGKVRAGIQRLSDKGYTYDKDGAVWFEATRLGDPRDRVLVRSNGSPTYLAADIAYITDKAERGYTQAIYVWGADHRDQVVSLVAAAQALELPVTVEVLVYQLVSLFADGREVRMSKRTGEIITLDELIDEVGPDAARYTFLLQSLDTPFKFDLDLVKSQSQQNPVHYVRYAHARICSILRLRAERGIELIPVDEAELGLLLHDTEQELVRLLGDYPETVMVAANQRAPYRLTAYAQEVAAAFHAFYRDCRVITDDADLTQARLWLAEAARQVLANVLGVLGVSAPERM